MVLRACSFETRSLLVKEWHSLLQNDWQRKDLEHVVANVLTEPVTRWLPPSMQGTYSKDRAREWVKERDKEGTTLLVVEKLTRQAVGLMLLFEMQVKGSSQVDVRLGYLLSEAN